MDDLETFTDFSVREDETSAASDEVRETPRPHVAKIRKCLVCKSPFESSWAGERVCRRCKSTSAWRGGALG